MYVCVGIFLCELLSCEERKEYINTHALSLSLSLSHTDAHTHTNGRLGESKERISSQYKFNLVIENEILEDYVTEKFFEGLKTGSLMVYLGAPNIKEYAPALSSFIDASA
jgi:hypothetical protein